MGASRLRVNVSLISPLFFSLANSPIKNYGFFSANLRSVKLHLSSNDVALYNRMAIFLAISHSLYQQFHLTAQAIMIKVAISQSKLSHRLDWPTAAACNMSVTVSGPVGGEKPFIDTCCIHLPLWRWQQYTLKTCVATYNRTQQSAAWTCTAVLTYICLILSLL